MSTVRPWLLHTSPAHGNLVAASLRVRARRRRRRVAPRLQLTRSRRHRAPRAGSIRRSTRTPGQVPRCALVAHAGRFASTGERPAFMTLRRSRRVPTSLLEPSWVRKPAPRRRLLVIRDSPRPRVRARACELATRPASGTVMALAGRPGVVAPAAGCGPFVALERGRERELRRVAKRLRDRRDPVVGVSQPFARECHPPVRQVGQRRDAEFVAETPCERRARERRVCC